MPQVVPGGRGRGTIASAVAPGAWGAGRGEGLPPGSSDDEEGGQQQEQAGDAIDAIQGRLFEQYLEACDELSGSEDEERDAAFAQGLARVAEWVSAGSTNSSMCLICLGAIKPREAVWHCAASCYAVFHLGCMQDWSRNQIDAAVARATHSTGAPPPRHTLEFSCPRCRGLYPAAQVPRGYTCFCGKTQDPEWDPWLAPHTCGELCGRPLPGGCGHNCRLLCHPGPHPPCPLVLDATCHCGKRSAKRRCGQRHFSCSAVCGKPLECGHACPLVCHEGDCAPCELVGSFRCQCGAEAKQAPCAQRAWQCGRVCGAPLSCGRHACGRACHAGPCGGCALEGRRVCPCGRTLYGELRCDEAAPPCGATCGKLLACGVHSCTERCHAGECPASCRILVSKPCRCGRVAKEVPCSSEVLCESRCTRMRDCGRHGCRRRCCAGDCPPCDQVCGRRLACGNHKCQSPCHSGPCRPCPLTFTVACACGRTKHTMPCGVESKAAPPRCPHPCPVPALCRHAGGRPQHRCHFGACPRPCGEACGAALTCGHECQTACHDRRPPVVADWERPKPPKNVAQTAAAAGAAAGGGAKGRGGDGQPAPPVPPAQAAAAAAAALAGPLPGRGALTPCPPCMAPVAVWCLGGHGSRVLPCSQAAPYACQAACGQLLPCSRHRCELACHVLAPEALAAAAAPAGGAPAGFDAAAASAAAAALPGSARPCAPCERPCARARAACGHACAERCHPEDCAPCPEPRRVPCRCGKTSLSFTCAELQRASAAGAAAGGGGGDALSCGRPCHRALPGCQHPCRQTCHEGACEQGACRDRVPVRCECRRRKEQWDCGRARDALRAATGGGDYDSGAGGLRLLACDGECAAQAKAAKRDKPAAAAGAAAAAAAAPAAAAAAAAAVAQPKQDQQQQQQQDQQQPSAKRMSRAEREALAARRAEAQLAEERRRRLVARATSAAAAAVVVGAVAAVAWLLYRLLAAPLEAEL
ncbi:hypothetical protein Rsub_08114 [Raphidocelis subcapitata]|uniref:NF-X1-type domain-containing protein n=1 Tax=Raphidocelis subcapitata TaxID=307507 RepID=A0A2V0P4R4_9CHLO|nr:hypothetical protein Rsub_08114 [Raphidocelis subcapitata]|eukprot:GBF94871.1 hypothetical protein Rsub_08114 [Raphidocelis subcapitata]